LFKGQGSREKGWANEVPRRRGAPEGLAADCDEKNHRKVGGEDRRARLLSEKAKKKSEQPKGKRSKKRVPSRKRRGGGIVSELEKADSEVPAPGPFSKDKVMSCKGGDTFPKPCFHVKTLGKSGSEV